MGGFTACSKLDMNSTSATYRGEDLQLDEPRGAKSDVHVQTQLSPPIGSFTKQGIILKKTKDKDL